MYSAWFQCSFLALVTLLESGCAQNGLLNYSDQFKLWHLGGNLKTFHDWLHSAAPSQILFFATLALSGPTVWRVLGVLRRGAMLAPAKAALQRR